MRTPYNPNQSPRVIIIQKLYGNFFNDDTDLTFPKHRFKKFIKDVVLGTIERDDILILVSNSGETKEIFDIIDFAKYRDIKIISITSNSSSTISRNSFITLKLPKYKEADKLRNELPQLTPWKERIFKYSLNATYSLSERFALSGKLTLLKISRDAYEENPSKQDYDSNQLIDMGLFFEAHKNLLIYSRISLSNHYLLGITPISYNRRTNHLFDHPYGQLYVGTLLKF